MFSFFPELGLEISGVGAEFDVRPKRLELIFLVLINCVVDYHNSSTFAESIDHVELCLATASVQWVREVRGQEKKIHGVLFVRVDGLNKLPGWMKLGNSILGEAVMPEKLGGTLEAKRKSRIMLRCG